MATAKQVEKLADGVCRALGGLHGAGAASNVICPVGVRLLREVVASRLEKRPASGARVLDSALDQLRSQVGLPARGTRLVHGPRATAEELVEDGRALVGSQAPFTGKQSTDAKLEAQMRGVQRHSMKGGAFRGAARRILEGINRKKFGGALVGGGGFIPGESGF